MKKEGKDVYILGDTETVIVPVEINNQDGSLDYVGIAFCDKGSLIEEKPVEVSSDLILGFRSAHSIEVLVERLMEIKNKLQESGNE